MTRQEAINKLVNECVNNFYDREDQEDYLAHLFSVGISGYTQMYDDELAMEYEDTFGEHCEIN